MKIDITREIEFRTARSGGKGGQNVNKLETMVEGRWNVAGSLLFNEEQKQVILQKLANRAGEGWLFTTNVPYTRDICGEITGRKDPIGK